MSSDFPIADVTIELTVQTDAFQSDKDTINNYSKAISITQNIANDVKTWSPSFQAYEMKKLII